MRILRITAILLAAASLLFCGWADYTYRHKQNHDVPTLTSDCELLEISVDDDEDALFQGLKAYDKTDGDLTDRIMVASTSHFIQPGVVNVKYVVFDRHNNSATLTRKVKYTDYTGPRFVLDAENVPDFSPVYIKGERFDLLDVLKVEDDIDGDISTHIRILSSTVSNYTTGTFPILLSAANSYGDTAEVELRVSYVEKADATVDIRLTQYIVYLEEGDTFDPRALLVRAVAPGNVTIPFDQIDVAGTLDTGTAGTYHLDYQYNDGSLRGQTHLTVIVREAGDA